MNLKTKQRVIGGIVLLALIAIFSPIIFHHTKSDSQLHLPTKIPSAPSAPAVDLQLPATPSENLVDKKSSNSVPTKNKIEPTDIQAAKTVSTKPQYKPQSKPSKSKAIISVNSVPVAWVIQLGSFGNKDNAKHLVKKLQSQGFDSYLRTEKEKNGKMLTKVFIGPEINLEKIKGLRSRLAKELQLNGVIRRYQL